MSFFQVSFRVSDDQVDALEELLYEVDDGHWNIFLDHDSQEAVVSGVFETEEAARADWNRIGKFFEELVGSVEVSFEVLPDKDWKDSYKEHFKAWNFGNLHWVPVWEKDSYSIPEGDAVVWLDPGMAFGTGNHETTRLCIEALIDFINDPARGDLRLNKMSCCDAGCGSGILGLSARKLGFGSVVGFDNDPDAVRISYENTDLNHLDGEIEFWEGDLEVGFRRQSYDLVFANILGVILVQHPYALLNAVKPGGRLILSGFLPPRWMKCAKFFRKSSSVLKSKVL